MQSHTQIRCDSIPTSAPNPCPSSCPVPPRGLIVGDTSRLVCPFLFSALSSGSVAGSGWVWSAKELNQMKRRRPDLRLTCFCLWLARCASLVRNPARSTFSSDSALLLWSQQQLVSLISPASPVLWLNVHKSVKTAAVAFGQDWKEGMSVCLIEGQDREPQTGGNKAWINFGP